MTMLAFDENIRQQIRKVVDYANQNIYELDDILDMMNTQMSTPGEKPEHLILVPMGRWICYYLVNHPEYGRCHYFSFSPDASDRLPDKPMIEYVLKEFDVDTPLLDQHIYIDKTASETKVILPLL